MRIFIIGNGQIITDRRNIFYSFSCDGYLSHDNSYDPLKNIYIKYIKLKYENRRW